MVCVPWGYGPLQLQDGWGVHMQGPLLVMLVHHMHNPLLAALQLPPPAPAHHQSVHVSCLPLDTCTPSIWVQQHRAYSVTQVIMLGMNE